MEERKDGLTPEEGEIMDLLNEAATKFGRLERQHPDELRYFADGIHVCQAMLGLRVVRKDHPEGWPIKRPPPKSFNYFQLY